MDWNKFKDIPPFVASIIAVVAALFGVAIWISAYFATQAQLKNAEVILDNKIIEANKNIVRTRCIAELNINMLSEQIRQKYVFDEFLKCKNGIGELEKKKKNNESFSYVDQQKLTELKASSGKMWIQITNSIEEMERLDAVLKSNNIFTPSGDCKSTKGG